jgi:molybdopterin molybdotransferase
VRLAGSDFRQGQVLIKSGICLDASAITLAAAAGHGSLRVRKRPRVAILATGDELVEPGAERGPDQIVSSNPYGLAALLERAGAEPRLLGIAGDTREALAARLEAARDTDVLVTIGGASVGDRDLVRPVLEASGMQLDFWKVAIRPGKPMLYGSLRNTRVFGLPGNPLSCLITARVFVVPLLYRLLGRETRELGETAAVLTHPLPANGPRQHYSPGVLAHDSQAVARITPIFGQDSARLTRLVGADALIVRAPGAPSANEGQVERILPFDP